MKQVFNPYLPSWEYVPDGEPHVFGDRIYVYGSHDIFNSNDFCQGDYICWSCPVNDLKDWKYEGVIWKRKDDPKNWKNSPLYAPDVCQGADGRYYLYYFYGYSGRIGVAVCDTPAGHYTFHGFVHYADGTIYGSKKGDIFQFDPGVYVEDGVCYLYTGFAPINYPFFLTGGKPITKHGPVCATLKSDMLTIVSTSYMGVECRASGKGTPYEGHEFFEAASMRKIGKKYYFIYSSFLGHELCYAVSDNPINGFTYGGVIVSIGDVGLRGIKGVKDAANFTGNTHGSIVCDANGQYYIFYHRQTNRHCFSRQACAEPITIEADGSIKQVEVTSCGLNGSPLIGKGTYPSYIACNLTCKKGGMFYSVLKCTGRPYFTQDGKDREGGSDQYIKNMTDGSKAGFKYFAFEHPSTISVTVRGTAKANILVTDETGLLLSTIPINGTGASTAPLSPIDGVHALFFEMKGKGKLDFISFTLN